MMTNIELANKLKNIAKNYKTLYVMGCFGAPMTATNKKRYTQNHSYNRQAARTAITIIVIKVSFPTMTDGAVVSYTCHLLMNGK